MKHVFVLDDDPGIIAIAESLLKDMGYAVSSELDPLKALERISESPPDLVLLDIRMPVMDGFDVCRKLKENANTRSLPIIIVSTQSKEADVVTGLELGANDYVCKPFRERELQARIKSLLRRKEDIDEDKSLEKGPLKIYPKTFSASVNNKPITLTAKEFQLLFYFFQRDGQVCTRPAISEAVWGHSYDPKMRTIDRHVDILRKKLGREGRWITGLRGIGYRFEIDDNITSADET